MGLLKELNAQAVSQLGPKPGRVHRQVAGHLSPFGDSACFQLLWERSHCRESSMFLLWSCCFPKAHFWAHLRIRMFRHVTLKRFLHLVDKQSAPSWFTSVAQP